MATGGAGFGSTLTDEAHQSRRISPSGLQLLGACVNCMTLHSSEPPARSGLAVAGIVAIKLFWSTGACATRNKNPPLLFMPRASPGPLRGSGRVCSAARVSHPADVGNISRRLNFRREDLGLFVCLRARARNVRF